MKRILLLGAAAISTPVVALAHAGHGAFHGHSPAHWLSSPEHFIPLALGLVLVGALALRRSKAK